MQNSWFQRTLLAGFIFQSVLIGGGYATGRELVEFFLTLGPVGGLLAMAVTTVVFSLVLMVSFELARKFQAFDYRAFFKPLLGRFWFLYEILYGVLLLLILAVIGAASGEIIAGSFGLPKTLGAILLMALIGFLVFFGTRVIERFLAGWSFVLYAVYAVFVVWAVITFGDLIGENLNAGQGEGNWLLGGIKYAGYNLGIVPVILFCVRHFETRRDAFVSGALGGPISMIPALFFFMAMVGYYPEVISEPVPLTFLLDKLSAPWFFLVFQIVIFGTFIETGSAMIHGINERIAHMMAEQGKDMAGWMRPAIAIVSLFAATYLATAIGIADLVASGYGYLTYGFIAVFILPLLTRGVWLIFSARSAPSLRDN